ncbi:MAG TPA: alkaline phosphatase family protein [Acidimicrobiales bacterium]|nr:alkaline phosphatase family protein [Acidimicrobiales bacterium]
MWIVMENNGFSQIVGNPAAPFLNRLAAECGLATNYLAVAHPSLPNYLALTSGSTDGVTDDAEPAAHRLSVPNIFSQLGGRWKALEEAMPGPCDRVTSGQYAARHDPAVYYVDLGATCARDVVPLRYPLELSAPFTFITPDVCNDMHDCSVATGDAWLARTVGDIVASSEYRSGRTALFIVWDESESSGPNRVAAFVVAPSVPRGERVALPFTHYSLLATAEDLLGLARLGSARSARSMVAPFHL